MTSQALAKASVIAQGYARDFPLTPKRGLLFVGPSGTGKTHLAVSVAKQLLARGHEVVFFDYQSLLEQIRAGYSETIGVSREAYQAALDAEILLLDDLGAHRTTEWTQDTVTAIVTHRYNHCKPLIATTNLPDPEIGGTLWDQGFAGTPSTPRVTLEQAVGSRARSRLFEMCKIIPMLSIGDYRIGLSSN